MSIHRVEIESLACVGDALATQTAARLQAWLGYSAGAIRTRQVMHLDLGLSDTEACQVLDALVDPVAQRGALGMLPDEFDPGGPWGAPGFVTVALRPGVTDSVGATVKRAAEDRLGRPLTGSAYASTLYLVWGLSRAELERAGTELLHNPLIERLVIEQGPRTMDLEVPRAGTDTVPSVSTVPLRDADDATLSRISNEGMLALNLVEMRAIAAHFAELGRDPTDAELECLAQTWSEHCKHKIFAAPIEFVDANGEVSTLEHGLFRTYIQGATTAVAKARIDRGIDPPELPFLVSVFHDNAGVVRFTERDHLVYKVETHNSPSALDPYGGAMTGIVGVNRDSFGTGRGADLLTNVWGYCFADPHYTGRIPAGLMHPRRIRDGVHHGVIDGGNQSGLPYSRGFELFDDRYLGKPLVFCGTVAAMPVEAAGRPTHEKFIAVGDKVVMVGGRIGKDGIHGATFSSVELDENSPVQAVQIGDPLTQKMMFDMLSEARDRGLLSGMTDNGAGGLSSSVGEMAEATGGARIDLALAPLKYPGLAPWEILISEAQERMTLAIAPDRLDAFMELAARREVEATVLGEFTRTGRFEVDYGPQSVVSLSLDFLHEGVPRTRLQARLQPPVVANPAARIAARAACMAEANLGERILELLGTPNLAGDPERARSYDHEVKGSSVIKPLIGVRGDVPATASVMRVRHGRNEGVVLGEGIHPYFSDLDAHAMAQACVDEGVRRVLCAGARWDRLAALDNFCWPDPVRRDRTPDGEHKLAQLVRCCQGLYEACIAYGLPLISGKDSMKNDALLEGVKISIPPTLLVSVMGQMQQVSAALTLQPRTPGDVLWVLGATRAELGASEVMRAAGWLAAEVPRTDVAVHAERYQAFVELRDAGHVRSAHVAGRGGLALALAHMVLAAELGVAIDVDTIGDGLHPFEALFAETTGRIVFTTASGDASHVERMVGEHGLRRLGAVTAEPTLTVSRAGRAMVVVPVDALRTRFAAGLAGC